MPQGIEPIFPKPEDCALFERSSGTRALGKALHYFERASSTNDLALAAGRTHAPHGSVFVADAQDSGRGRRGRSWECPPARGLLFSVLLRPLPVPTPLAGWIPLLAGLACVRACAAMSPHCGGLALKWPNDIVLPASNHPGWSKLGGILCESVLAEHAAPQSFVVAGIGLNVNQSASELPPLTKAPASSLSILAGEPLDRRLLLRQILQEFELALDLFADESSRAGIQDCVVERMRALFAERRIVLSAPCAGDSGAREQSGRFAGLDEFGRLLLRDSGAIRALADAEITGMD